MPPPKLIVIVGITGNQGASVADQFVNDPSWKVRGISRDPSKPSSKEWSDKGVEMVPGDLDDLASLRIAFTGANVVFGVTDFWQFFWNPENHKRAAEIGKTINQVCYDMEVRQGKNIIDAAYSTINTLDLLVLSTIGSSTKWSGGKITTNYHFDAKWEAVEYTKATYPDLYKKTSLLQLALYLTNWRNGGVTQPQKQADGTYIVKLPVRPDSKIPMVEPRVDCGKFVKVLTQTKPGMNLAGTASLLSWKEWVEIWGRIMDVTCTYEEISDDVLPDMIPGGVGQELNDMFRYMDEFGYYGSDPTLTWPKDLGIELPLLTVEEYIKQEDWTSVMK